MALVTSKEMFAKAYDGGYAIGAFNVNNMEIVQGITEACQEEHAPVILQVSKGARAYANHTYLVKLVEAAVIENPEIPIALHLDHGDSFELCKSCIDGGFTSVMIDASSKSFEDNIALTRKVVEYAHDHGVVVEGDRALLGRLLTNLVGNAYRSGRENGYIRVKVERADGCVLLSVEDNGVGIAPEQQEKVFNRFYQADAARSGEGTGLGLAMAREIARLHGGDIRVTSEPGKGSIFVFEMPEKNSAL